MYESIINLVCDGDYQNRDRLRQWLTLEDILLIEKKKTAQN